MLSSIFWNLIENWFIWLFYFSGKYDLTQFERKFIAVSGAFFLLPEKLVSQRRHTSEIFFQTV